MHSHTLEPWQHAHHFSANSEHAEKSTTKVMVLTATMMVIEILAGMMSGSMALLADGWHMATHVAAFGLAVFAYRYARRYANHPRFTFGTGKVSVLGGFASAVALAVVALIMALESCLRMVTPQTIHFNEAITVAVIGLLVNLLSGWMLHERHEHHHQHEHEHEHEHRHTHRHDHNLRAAYLHVVADALTSVLAIVALVCGTYWGWIWLDPAMGLVGAVVIGRWSYGLLGDTSAILLDSVVDPAIDAAIRSAIDGDADNRIADLHLWSMGPEQYSVMVSVVTHQPQAPEYYKRLLHDIPHLAHVLIEVNQCHD